MLAILRAVTRRQTVAYSLMLLVALLVLGGCRERQRGNEIAATGKATATVLAAYYDSLIQDTVDAWRLEVFWRATVLGLPAGMESDVTDLMVERERELALRAQAARDLANLYGTMQELSEYDAESAAGQAGEELATSLVNIGMLPGGGYEPVFRWLSGELTRAAQSRSIEEANTVILRLVRELQAMFGTEMDAYRLITRERTDKIGEVAESLVDEGRLDVGPLLDDIQEIIGLEWAPGEPDLGDDSLVEAAKLLLRVRSQQHALASASAAEEMNASLLRLISAHEQLAEGRGLDLEDIEVGLGRLESLLQALERTDAKTRDESGGGETDR